MESRLVWYFLLNLTSITNFSLHSGELKVGQNPRLCHSVKGVLCFERCDTASARRAESVWYTGEIIKLNRSIKMSAFLSGKMRGGVALWPERSGELFRG